MLDQADDMTLLNDPGAVRFMFATYIDEEERHYSERYTGTQSMDVDTSYNASNNDIIKTQYPSMQSSMNQLNQSNFTNKDYSGPNGPFSPQPGTLGELFMKRRLDESIRNVEDTNDKKNKQSNGKNTVTVSEPNVQDDIAITLIGGPYLTVSVQNTNAFTLAYKMTIRSTPLDSDGKPINTDGLYPIDKAESINPYDTNFHSYNAGEGPHSHSYRIYITNEGRILEFPYSVNINVEASY